MEALDVLGQGVLHQGGPALLLGGGHVLVAVELGEGLGVVDDILALVAVLGEGHGLLALIDLQVPGFQRGPELVDLVAGVVDVELPLHGVAGGLQHRGQGVPQHPAPGVADVHGPGGVGRDELHQHPLALAHLAATVGGALVVDVLEDLPVEAAPVGEVQKPGARHLRFFKVGGGQVQVLQNGLGDFLGGHAVRPGPGHGGVAGPVPVGPVPGDLQNVGGGRRLGQVPLLHGEGQGLVHRLAQLFCGFGDQL